MRMDELKRGLWGYRKDSVYHYVVSLEEKASQRLAEKEARIEKLTAEYKQQLTELESESKRQLAELEATLKALREENAALRENQAAVFTTMLEAQKYADQLRTESNLQRQQAQERFSSAIQQKTRLLDVYSDQIQQLRVMIKEILKDFEGSLEDVERTTTRLSAHAPSADLDEQDTPQPEPDKGDKEAWKKISFI